MRAMRQTPAHTRVTMCTVATDGYLLQQDGRTCTGETHVHCEGESPTYREIIRIMQNSCFYQHSKYNTEIQESLM